MICTNALTNQTRTYYKEAQDLFDRMNLGEIVSFTDLDTSIQQLITMAATAREYSYSPYSNFKVGAAVLSFDENMYSGCNVENSAYPAGICAERTAIVKAVSEGTKKFKALSVVADSDDFCTPCGICRQTIAEFGNLEIYLSKSDTTNILCVSLVDMLPLAFSGRSFGFP